MNKDEIKGNWKIAVGKLKQNYGDAFHDMEAKDEGDAEVIIGRIQKHYGKTREEAKRIVDDAAQADDTTRRV
jgi:uncharacterized protein YjbJ (UPF0337 family)